MQTAVGALVWSWSLDEIPSEKLIERLAYKLQRQQRRAAAARKSHDRKTRKRLRDLGIKLTDLPKCTLDST